MNTNNGWKLVPAWPTEEMLTAARQAPIPMLMVDSYSAEQNLRNGARYRAMLAAAPEAPSLTVTVDPDPRGVSVGVYLGSSCVYHGAHAIPAGAVADEVAKDERQAFEVWAKERGYQSDELARCKLGIVSPEYFNLNTENAWKAWQGGRASVAAPAAGDAQIAGQLLPKLQSLLDRMANDPYTGTMFEADGDTLRDAMHLCRSVVVDSASQQGGDSE